MAQSYVRRRSLYPVMKALVLQLCLGVSLLSACTKAPTMKEAKPPTAAQLTEFAQHTGIVFPPSAVPQLYWEIRGMDDALFLKLTLPKDAFPKFIAAAPFAGTKMTIPKDFPNATLRYFNDWMPRPPQNFQICDPSLPNARYLRCIFDFDDPQTTTIYLMWFET